MPVDIEALFAGPARRSSVSPIARTLEIVDRTPGMISFACGNPATEALPVEPIARAATRALHDRTKQALQYVRPRGIIQETLVEYLQRDGVRSTPAELLPTTGAIQALALIAHALVAPGDLVVTEWPTYPVNLATFRTRGARTIGVPMDDEGMRVDRLAALLNDLDTKPKLIYVIPDAQNPTGITMSLARRRALVEIAARHEVLIVEDAPYRGISYGAPPVDSLHALAAEAGATAIYVGSFAKTVAPGLRVGFMAAPAVLVDRCVLLKQGEDFCSPGLTHLVVAALIREGVIEQSIARMCAVQGPKRDAMLAALDRHLGKVEGVSWTRPVGGLFVWLTLPPHVDTDELLERCIEERVAFIPGRYFYPAERVTATGEALPEEAPRHECRLNFSDPPLDEIDTGIAALGRVLASMLRAGQPRGVS